MPGLIENYKIDHKNKQVTILVLILVIFLKIN